MSQSQYLAVPCIQSEKRHHKCLQGDGALYPLDNTTSATSYSPACRQYNIPRFLLRHPVAVVELVGSNSNSFLEFWILTTLQKETFAHFSLLTYNRPKEAECESIFRWFV